jgi:replicative DNA helicase
MDIASLPHCQYAEQSLLGACLIASQAPPCSPDDFYFESHRSIAGVMQELERSGNVVDLVTVFDKLAGQKEIPATYLAQLLESLASSDNLEIYAGIVKEKAAARRAVIRAMQFIQESENLDGNTASVLNGFCRDIMTICDTSRTDRETTALETLKNFFSRFDDKIHNPSKFTGIQTGIYELDHLTFGLHPQDELIIAARPSLGKTAMALNIARNALSLGHPVIIFSMEMSAESLVQRLLASESRVPLDKVRSSWVTEKEHQKILTSAGTISQWPLKIVDSPVNAFEILQKLRKHRPTLAVIDYLQLVQPLKSTGNANYDLGEISKTIKRAAQELNIPIILLSQLTRSNEREKRKPRLSDLRDTGQLEQDADMILFIHAEDHTRNFRELILAKHRNGDCGVWKATFLRPIQRFERYGAAP